MATPVLTREATLALKRQFRQRYAHASPGHIVSVGLGRDGAHAFWRILVSSEFHTRALPRSFAGLPVLARKTSVGHAGR
jgi:hypothetical protein